MIRSTPSLMRTGILSVTQAPQSLWQVSALSHSGLSCNSCIKGNTNDLIAGMMNCLQVRLPALKAHPCFTPIRVFLLEAATRRANLATIYNLRLRWLVLFSMPSAKHPSPRWQIRDICTECAYKPKNTTYKITLFNRWLKWYRHPFPFSYPHSTTSFCRRSYINSFNLLFYN